MNKKPDNITLLRELFITQMNHWMFFPIYAMLITLCGVITGKTDASSSLILLWLGYGCIPFLLYLGRVLFKKIWILAFLSLGILFLMYRIPTSHMATKVLHIFVGLLYVIHSLYLRMQTTHKNNSKISPAAGVTISAVCLFVLLHQGHSCWTSVFITVLIIALGLFFIAYYIEQYQNFLSANASSAGYIAQKELFCSGALLVTGYTGIGLLLLFLVSNTTWLNVILQAGKKILFFLLRLLFSLIPRSTRTEEFSSSPATMEMPEYMEPLPGGETSLIWLLLEKVAMVITFAGVIFLLIKIITFLVKFIRKMLMNYEPDSSKYSREEDVYDVREKCSIEKDSDWQMALSFFTKNPKMRIRQLYKRCLLSSRTVFTDNTEASSLNCLTARESSRLLNRDEMAQIYEKARYSSEKCDDDDVRNMKKACK